MNDAIQQFDLGEAQETPKKYMRGAEPFFQIVNPDIGALLLHGFTASPYQFKELRVQLVKKNISVSVPVIAGHGTAPEDLMKTSIEDWISSVESAYKALKEKVKNIVVIGSSFGGNLAFQLAIKNDNAIKGIISLGTPIYIRYQKFIYFRYYAYGWLKKFYKKRGVNYKPNYTDAPEVVSYPIIPIKSLKNFLNFVKYFTIPSLKNINTPALIIQANQDTVVHPKSAQFIHQFLGSEFKKVCWLDGTFHSLDDQKEKKEIFDIMHSFILEVSKNNNNHSNKSLLSLHETDNTRNPS